MAKVVMTLEDKDGKVSVNMETLEHDGDKPTQALIVGMALYNACMSFEKGFEDDEETD